MQYHGQIAIKVAVHAVADELVSCMIECEHTLDRLDVLQSICKTALACRGYWKLFYDLEDADEGSIQTPEESRSQDIQASSFIVALASRYTEVQAEYLRRGFDSNVQTRYFGSPLQIASQYGYCDTVETLLDSGADINQLAYSTRWTALETAAWHGHIDVVRLLLHPKYNLRTSTPNFGEAACKAVKRRHPEIASIILNRNAKIPLYSQKGLCWLAAKHGYDEIVTKMLDAGLDQNTINNGEGTALSGAAENGHCSTVALLLDRGANVRQFSHDAFICAAEGGQLEVLDMMLKRGIDMEVRNRMFQAFVAASIAGQIQAADFLINHGLHIKSPESKGWRYYALWNAMKMNRLDMVRWLFLTLRLCPDGEAEVVDGDHLGTFAKTPPMVYALDVGTLEMVSLLLELGAKSVDLKEGSHS